MGEPEQLGVYERAARSVGWISALRAIGLVLSFVQMALYAFFFGAGREMDIFFAASVLFTTTNKFFLGGTVATVFLPIFTERWAKKDYKEAWIITSNLFNVLAGLTLLIGGIVFYLAPWIIPFVVPGFEASARGTIISMTRFLLPMLTLVVLGNFVTAVLHALRRFVWVEVTDSVLSPGLGLLALSLLAPSIGLWSLPVALMTGALTRFLFLLGALLGNGFRYTFSFDWKNPAVRETIKSVSPFVVSKVAVQAKIVAMTALISFLPQGSLAILQYTSNIYAKLCGLSIVPVQTVVYPSLAAAAIQKLDQLRVVMGKVLRVIFLICLPMTLFLVLLRTPITAIIFERGRFQSSDTVLLANALACYALGLMAEGAVGIFKRGLYALKRPFQVAGIQILGEVIHLFFILLLIGPLGYLGVALSSSLMTLTIAMVYWAALSRAMPETAKIFVSSFYMKLSAAALACGATLFGMKEILRYLGPEKGLKMSLFELAVIGGAGFLVFVVTLRQLRLEEVQIALTLFKQRLAIQGLGEKVG